MIISVKCTVFVIILFFANVLSDIISDSLQILKNSAKIIMYLSTTNQPDCA
jgi:hypothetical protein